MVRSLLGSLSLALILVLALAPHPAWSSRAQAQEPARPPEPAPAAVETRTHPAPPSGTETQGATTPVPTPALAKPGAAIGRQSIVALFSRSNPMLWLLALCSIVTVGYTLERLVALRRGRVIPRDFVHRFLERLSSGKLNRERAAELCRANESPMARIFGHVVRYWGQPAATIRTALDHDASREVLDLRRNVRVLNGTSTLAPLLGLLGTVLGMIQSFDAISGRSGGAKGDALAQGISLALVSTALGLAIAIVSVAAYYYLLNRVDLLVRDMDDQARRVIDLVSAEAFRPTDRRVDLDRVDVRTHQL